MEEMIKNYGRGIVMGCAILLCILFFTLPLVQCSQDSSVSASGWEIATGTGDLFDKDDNGGYPFFFMLLLIPAVILIYALINKSYGELGYISALGIIAKVSFLIVTYVLLNSSENKGAFELTVFAWLVLVLYIGLCVFCQYCRKLE